MKARAKETLLASSRGKRGGRRQSEERKRTHDSIRRTELVLPHFSTSLALYSLDALSLESMTPSESVELAFQILTLPSSDAVRTNVDVGVYVTSVMRCIRLVW